MTVALETLSVATLADLYNLLAENPVKKFSDKAAGVRRLSALLILKSHEVFQAEGEYDVRPIEQLGEKIDATETLNTDEYVEMVSIAADKPKKTGGGKRGPAPRHADSAVITVLVANPKKKGSASWDRFQKYTTGLRVGEYLAAGGRRADLDWDITHSFISVK